MATLLAGQLAAAQLRFRPLQKVVHLPVTSFSRRFPVNYDSLSRLSENFMRADDAIGVNLVNVLPKIV